VIIPVEGLFPNNQLKSIAKPLLNLLCVSAN